MVVHLRRTLLLPLDDLLAVAREFICPHVSRSGMDRCLCRWRYLFVAIDRATRRVFVQLRASRTAASAQAFLKALLVRGATLTCKRGVRVL